MPIHPATQPPREPFQGRRITPGLRRLAEDLVAHDAKAKESSETRSAATFRVVEELRPHLAGLMGGAGFRALISRALVLAIQEVSWLRAVQVKENGHLDGLDKLEAQVEPDESVEGRVVLVAQLLGLLVAFIGESLMLRMLSEIWPRLSLKGLNANKRMEE